jgi:membrane protease YdiL (CAAX protease family)
MNAFDATRAMSSDEATSISLQAKRQSPGNRWISFAELALGSAIVIGHNVYHVVPNEVPILFVIGLLSFRLRDGGRRRMGLHWPTSWRRTLLIALGAAALRILLGTLVVEPVTSHFWPPAIAPSGSDAITGNLRIAFQWLVLVWTFAAFGEEIGYRGYLINRAADAGGRSKAAYWGGVFLVSVLSDTGTTTRDPPGSWTPARLA